MAETTSTVIILKTMVCENCPNGYSAQGGYSTDTDTGVNYASCQKCGHGMYSGRGEVTCQACDAAHEDLKYPPSNNSGEMSNKEPCDRCRPGKFGTGYGAGDTCIQCPSGYASNNPYTQTPIYTSPIYTTTGAKKSFSAGCQKCPKGRGPLGDFTGDRVQCVGCPVGYLSTETGPGDGTYNCVACAMGKHDPKGAPGTKKNTIGGTVYNNPCRSCPAGYYGTSIGQGSCIGCAPGLYTKNSTGNTGCLGERCAAGLVGPVACFPGRETKDLPSYPYGFLKGCDENVTWGGVNNDESPTNLCRSCRNGELLSDGNTYGQCGYRLCSNATECRDMNLDTADNCKSQCGNKGSTTMGIGDNGVLRYCSCASNTEKKCNGIGQYWQCVPAPTPAPTRMPTNTPTLYPTRLPTAYPTSPTPAPTTLYPTSHPSSVPTSYPTTSPTNYPTSRPTTSYPTTSPTSNYPTRLPSHSPTPKAWIAAAPTKRPTVAQTKSQTVKTTSSAPTNAPTAYPTYKFGAQVQIVELQMTLNGFNKESFNEAAQDAFKVSVALLLGVKKNNVIVIILPQTASASASASAQRTRHRRLNTANSVTLDVQIFTADTAAAAQAVTVLGQPDFETSLATTMTSDAVKMQVPIYTTTSSITVDDIAPSKISTSQAAMTQAMVTATNTGSNPGTTSNDAGGSTRSDGVGAGVIAGAVIGALAGVALLIVGSVMARNRKAGRALGLQRGPSAVNVQSAATGTAGASIARKLSDSSITTAHTNPMKADEL